MPIRHTIAVGGTILACLAAPVLVPDAARAQTACSVYTVERGDTLREIAQSAYGDDGRYLEVYEVNRETIGGSPNRIEIGLTLTLPCRDGTLPSGRQSLPDTNTTRLVPDPPERGPEPEAKTSELEPDGTLRILTTGSTPPFADARQPGLGLFAELIVRAMETGSPDQPFRIELQPDERAVLLASEDATPALSFPWYRPDCSNPDFGTATAAQLCRRFAFSQPIYTLTIGLYVLPGSVLASARGPADFSGTRICVPAEYLGPTAEATGLVPASASISAGRTMRTCVSDLVDGTVNAILVNPDMVALTGQALVVGLAGEADLVIAAPRGNAGATSALDTLEDDIAELTQGAEWSTIVEGQIAAHRRRVGLGL